MLSLCLDPAEEDDMVFHLKEGLFTDKLKHPLIKASTSELRKGNNRVEVSPSDTSTIKLDLTLPQNLETKR